MSKPGDDEDDDNNNECFYESLDRILSSTNSSCSSFNNSDDDDDVSSKDPYSNAPPASLPIPKFSMGVSNNYDVWISQPSSVEERRMRLLRQMGLSNDPSLSRHKPFPSTDDSGGAHKFSKSVSADHLSLSSATSGIVRSKSADLHEQCNSNSSVSLPYNNTPPPLPPEILSINSISSTWSPPCALPSTVNNRNLNLHNILVVDKDKPRSNGNSNVHSLTAVLPNKPPSGKNSKRTEEINRTDTTDCNDAGEVEGFDLDCNGVERDSDLDPVCTIKNLDNGKEFVVNQVREDGTWDKVKEVGTGRHLTMEEFEMCVGHSPIVQELMRRQNVESGNKDTLDLSANGSGGSGSKLKKKGSWLRSIKNVASSVTGYKERRSSDDKDTSSEKGGRRSSSATDDSQDVSFHGPERIRVRQYGKSCKDLTALYKSQEIQAHSGSIWSIKFSLDGKYLASAGEDCVIHVWQVGSSERKGDLILDKPEDGNLNILLLANGSPEPTSLSPNLEGLPEKKRRGRLSISRKSVCFDHVVMPETIFALSEKPLCSFQGHLDDVLDLSWSKSQVS